MDDVGARSQLPVFSSSKYCDLCISIFFISLRFHSRKKIPPAITERYLLLLFCTSRRNDIQEYRFLLYLGWLCN